MKPDRQFWANKKVCVTGGTGFLGWHLVRQLLPLARHVRVLGLPSGSKRVRESCRGLDCILADIRDVEAVARAVSDCDVVFHTAGIVGVWGRALQQMRSIHLEGTQNVLKALPERARLVHTSSVVAIGASVDSKPLTETSSFDLQQLKVDYIHAKKGAEELALVGAGRGQDVVVVNPGYLVGPEDYDRSAVGHFCIRFWKGKVPLIPPGGFNFVDVRDVALGQILAAEHGQIGRRYILGGENLSMMAFARQLAQVRGWSSRRRLGFPNWLFIACCGLAETYAYIAKREPFPSVQHVRMSRYRWYYSSERAQAELGYQPRTIAQSLQETHDWCCEVRNISPVARPVGLPRGVPGILASAKR